RLCGDNVPQMRVFEVIRDLTGRPLPRRIPDAVAWALGAFEEARSALLHRPPRLTRGTVQIFRRDWTFDSDLAMRDLGYRIIPIEEGLRRTLDSATGNLSNC
ncbi:MAG: hypothetical protein LC804_27400, partial [Acidobacteria bacterium]|nr:hypothetical protein [Acidobacteriota bacterium]